MFKWHYSRDLRPAKWGSGVSSHGSLSRPLSAKTDIRRLLHYLKHGPEQKRTATSPVEP
jgi:hypothetical protein